MAGFAIDAGLGPRGMVGVGFGIVIGRKLAHVAAVTGGIEGVGGLLPVDRLASLPSREMPHAASSGIEPFFLVHIKSDRECLKAPFLKEGQKVRDVLSAQDLFDPVFLFPFGPCFNKISSFSADISAIAVFADYYVILLRSKRGMRKFSSVRLHSKSVE